MATKVEYTSTISVPVYAAWKCPKCNCVNANNGIIQTQGTTTSYSTKKDKLEAAKDKAMSYTESQWRKNVLNLITDPRSFPESFRSCLKLGKVKCTNCGKQPKWNKSAPFLTILMVLAIFVGLIMLYPIIKGQATLTVWLILAACALIVFGVIQSDKIFEKRITTLPDQYVPVIGTQNEEMLVYADHYGKKIPTPEECIAIANSTQSKE